jgi:uncharacterized small protein (DUF1192 family)
MNPLFPTALLSLLLAAAPAHPQGPADKQAPGLVEQAKQSADALWEDSRASALDLWDRSKETAGDWWTRSQETADDAWGSTRRYLAPGEPDGFTQVWDGVLPTLEETLALEERHDALPRSAWFGEDQASNRAAIDKLLDQAVAVLSTSDVQQYRERIRVLQGEIAKARADIDEYRRRRVSAPTESLLKKTVADYDEAITERESDIRRYQEELGRIKRRLAEELRAIGLTLSDEQVELLLSTVVGDNLIDLGIVFDNVKAITQQLERLVEESGEDLKSARRYYGMYVILLESLHQMHVQVEQAIAGRYIPQIDAIADRARELSGETRALMRTAPEKRALLTANLEAQELTVRAAGVYRDYLDEQGRQVTTARVALEKDIAAAWNTYETVRVSGELVGLVQASRTLLDGLLERQVPTLRPFENLQMQREFEKLTDRLRAPEAGPGG